MPLLCERREEHENMQNVLENEPHTHPSREHREGPVARGIEQQTAKIPSDVFLWAALGSIGVSLVMAIRGSRDKANFIGQWVPTILSLGIYNKLVKLHGSEGR
jgi:hypothetical protein